MAPGCNYTITTYMRMTCTTKNCKETYSQDCNAKINPFCEKCQKMLDRDIKIKHILNGKL